LTTGFSTTVIRTLAGVVGVAWIETKVGADGFGFDALVAGHADIADDAAALRFSAR
jgi:hypothetical protein